MTRFPAMSEIRTVFSLILFIVYSYAIYRMAWYVPSWLSYLSVLEIIIIGAYAMVFGMFEILSILSILLVIVFFLPTQYFKLHFAAQSFIILCMATVCALIAHDKLFLYVPTWDFAQFSKYIVFALVIAIVVFAISYVVVAYMKGLRDLIRIINERLIIFIYIYLPLFVVSLFVVIVRNLM